MSGSVNSSNVYQFPAPRSGEAVFDDVEQVSLRESNLPRLDTREALLAAALEAAMSSTEFNPKEPNIFDETRTEQARVAKVLGESAITTPLALEDKVGFNKSPQEYTHTLGKYISKLRADELPDAA